MSVPAPHRVPVTAVVVGGQDHRDRGRTRGRLLAAGVRATSAAYADLFTGLGIEPAARREAAAASLDALRSWAPEVHDEVVGVAEGAGLDLADVALTLARTEILTLAGERPGECSTVAHQAPGASVSAQTWDWFARFAGCWHLHRVEALPGEVGHAGFAEHGMPGKVGLNAAGVGVHLNILTHRDDDAGGVPVHAVLARVLSQARTVAEALDIVRSAPTSSSSVLTLVDPDRVAMVEVAPGRVEVVEREGWALHTNHFHTQTEEDGARLLAVGSDTHARMTTLERATAGRPAPGTADDVLPVLCTPLDQHGVALLPDDTLPEAERVATLVTVRTDPAARRVSLSPGVPQHAEEVTVTYQL